MSRKNALKRTMKLLVLVGLLGTTAGIIGYATPAIRNAERLLPDHDAVTAV